MTTASALPPLFEYLVASERSKGCTAELQIETLMGISGAWRVFHGRGEAQRLFSGRDGRAAVEAWFDEIHAYEQQP